jgi:hypothetical protein
MTVLMLIEWFGLIEGGIWVFENIYWNEQQAATTRQGIKWMLACCK